LLPERPVKLGPLCRFQVTATVPTHRTRPGGRCGAQLPAGALRTCAQRLVERPALLGHYSDVVLQPASQKRPDSELRTANSVRALSFVSALLSLLVSLYSGMFCSDDQGVAFSAQAVAGRVSLTPKSRMRGGVRQAYADPWFLEIEMSWPQRKIRRRRSLGLRSSSERKPYCGFRVASLFLCHIRIKEFSIPYISWAS
jgi:hypothetical protein